MQYDKPFLTYNQQIELLKSRNLRIDDTDNAIRLLKEFSYYTLVNGYKDIVQNKDVFEDNYSIEDLSKLHFTAVSIHSFLLKYILLIENSLKSKLTYRIGEQYGVWTDLTDRNSSSCKDYLNITNYSNSSRYTAKRNQKLHDFKYKIMDGSGYRIRSKALLHYRTVHNHIPPWILATELTFADVIGWYSILKAKDKTAVCEAMLPTEQLDLDNKKRFLPEVLELQRRFRNSTAHNGKREWNFIVSNTVKGDCCLLFQNSFPDQPVEKDEFKGLSYLLLSTYFLLDTEILKKSFIRDFQNLQIIVEDCLSNGKKLGELFGYPSSLITKMNI